MIPLLVGIGIFWLVFRALRPRSRRILVVFSEAPKSETPE